MVRWLRRSTSIDPARPNQWEEESDSYLLIRHSIGLRRKLLWTKPFAAGERSRVDLPPDGTERALSPVTVSVLASSYH